MTACDAVRELLAAHALGALEVSEATLVRDHLTECADCRAAEADARADLAFVDAPAVPAPAASWNRIRGRIAASQAGHEPVRSLEPAAVIAVSCSFCRGALVRAEGVYCASCLAPHHPDCWSEYGRCSVMGCGEQRVVRPTERPEVAAAPQPVVSKPKDEVYDLAELRRRRRRRWVGGGLLVSAVTGGLAAAALNQPAPFSPVQLAGVPERTTTVAPPVEQRWDVDVSEASLSELCSALERETGAKIQLSASLADVLVHSGRWRNVTTDEVLAELVLDHGLTLRPEERGRRALDSREALVRDRAGPAIQRHTSQLHERGARGAVTRFLRSGPPHDVVTARTRRRFAVIEGRTARIGIEAVPFTLQSPITHASWDDDGSRLTLVNRTSCLAIDVSDEGEATIAARAPLQLRPREEIRSVSWDRSHDRPQFLLKSGDVVGPDGKIESSPIMGAGAARWTLGDTDAAGQRVVVCEVGVARVLSVATGEQVGATIEGKALELRVDLSPDGQRVAWLDGQTLRVRHVVAGDSGADTEVFPPDRTSEGIRGFAWSGEGSRLALWTARGKLGLVDAADLDAGGSVEARSEHEDPDLVDARWAGDALVLFTTQHGDRLPRIVVTPAGLDVADAAVDLELRPPELGPPPAGSIFGERTPGVTPPAATESPAPAEDPPATTETPAPAEPAPATTEAGPVTPEVVLPAPMAHVRPGQRYTFAKAGGEVLVWDVLEVHPTHVIYTSTLYIKGTKVPDPRRQTFTPRLTGQIERGGKTRPQQVHVGGITFECVVSEMLDERHGTRVVNWTAMREGRECFPGRVRYERGDTVIEELVGIE